MRHAPSWTSFVAISAILSLTVWIGGCTSGGDKAENEAVTDTIPVTLPFAPYVDFDSKGIAPAVASAATGQRDFTLGFLLAAGNAAGGHACEPAWSGTLALTDPAAQSRLADLKALGGRVAVATGGASGTYLEKVCGTADELAAAWGKALDSAGSNHLDVDIEQSSDPDRIADAVVKLQAARDTAVTYTVAVDGKGLTEASSALLRAAAGRDAPVTVNLMVMNFAATGAWGAALVAATKAAHDDLKAIWPDRDDRERYAMLGLTPMIGINDTGPVTTLDDARTLLDFARTAGIGFLRFWSVGRDNGNCQGPPARWDCSGVAQSPFAYTELFRQYTPAAAG